MLLTRFFFMIFEIVGKTLSFCLLDFYIVRYRLYIYITHKIGIGMLFNHDCHVEKIVIWKSILSSVKLYALCINSGVYLCTLSSFKLVHLVGFAGYCLPISSPIRHCSVYIRNCFVYIKRQMKLDYFKCIISISWIHRQKLISNSGNIL